MDIWIYVLNTNIVRLNFEKLTGRLPKNRDWLDGALIPLSKREKGVNVVIYTKEYTKKLQLDLERVTSG